MYFSKKARITVCFCLLVLVVISFGSVSYANDNFTNQLENTNIYLQNTIDRTVSVADKQLESNSVRVNAVESNSAATVEISAKLNEQADVRNDSTAVRLVTNTDRTVSNLTDRASRNGVTIESQYVPVTVGDETVMVDPFKFCY